MKTWTVIGYYEDNNQAWAGSFEAETWEEAQAIAHKDREEDEWGSAIVVVGVVEGAHTVHGGDYPDGDC